MRATFRNTEKYDVDDAPPYFEAVVVRLEIVSSASAEQVKRLAAHAERACHAAQSLRHAIPVSLETTLNGASLNGSLRS